MSEKSTPEKAVEVKITPPVGVTVDTENPIQGVIDESFSEAMADLGRGPRPPRSLIMTATEYARQLCGIDNEPGLDIFFTEHKMSRNGPIIVWETGFAMNGNSGRLINTPDIPDYAQENFWSLIARTAVSDKPMALPGLPQMAPQMTPGAQVAANHPQGENAIKSLELFPGEGGGVFVLTWENGTTDSNPKLDALLTSIGQTVEQLINDGVKVAI